MGLIKVCVCIHLDLIRTPAEEIFLNNTHVYITSVR